MEQKLTDIMKQAFQREQETILATGERMDPEAFERAVYALADAPRIATTGCGHSGIACMHFAHLMCCAEKPARFLSPAEAVHGAAGFMQSGDVLVWTSRGGKTDELFPILDICHKKSVTVIGITERPESELAKESDIILPIRVTEETDKYNCQGTSSFVAVTAVFDALQAAVIEVTGYQNEQFALIHPGGAVGKRLAEKR